MIMGRVRVGGHIGFFKKPMDEVLRTLQKLFFYVFINSY